MLILICLFGRTPLGGLPFCSRCFLLPPFGKGCHKNGLSIVHFCDIFFRTEGVVIYLVKERSHMAVVCHAFVEMGVIGNHSVPKSLCTVR